MEVDDVLIVLEDQEYFGALLHVVHDPDPIVEVDFELILIGDLVYFAQLHELFVVVMAHHYIVQILKFFGVHLLMGLRLRVYAVPDFLHDVGLSDHLILHLDDVWVLVYKLFQFPIGFYPLLYLFHFDLLVVVGVGEEVLEPVPHIHLQALVVPLRINQFVALP